MHTSIRHGLKVKPPDRFTSGASSSLSYHLGSTESDETEVLAYHRDYVYQELPRAFFFIVASCNESGKRIFTEELCVGTHCIA